MDKQLQLQEHQVDNRFSRLQAAVDHEIHRRVTLLREMSLVLSNDMESAEYKLDRDGRDAELSDIDVRAWDRSYTELGELRWLLRTMEELPYSRLEEHIQGAIDSRSFFVGAVRLYTCRNEARTFRWAEAVLFDLADGREPREFPTG